MRYAAAPCRPVDHTPSICRVRIFSTFVQQLAVANIASMEDIAGSSFCVETMVRGYHVYEDIWSAVVGEELPFKRERTNTADPFAVSVTGQRGDHCGPRSKEDSVHLLMHSFFEDTEPSFVELLEPGATLLIYHREVSKFLAP